MRKVLAFVLMVAMMMTFAVPAYAAVSSPAATEQDIVPTVTIESKDFTVVSADKIEELPEEAQKTFAEAKENLAAAAPAGMAVKYFFYFSAVENATTTSTNASFTLKGVTNAVVKQFIDGKWVELECTLDADGNLIVNGLGDGPVAIFTK